MISPDPTNEIYGPACVGEPSSPARAPTLSMSVATYGHRLKGASFRDRVPLIYDHLSSQYDWWDV